MYCQFWVATDRYCGKTAVYISLESRTYCPEHGGIIDATLSPTAKTVLRWRRLDNKSSEKAGEKEVERGTELRSDWLDPTGGSGDSADARGRPDDGWFPDTGVEPDDSGPGVDPNLDE